MTPETFFKIPHRKQSKKKSKFVIGKYDPNKKQNIPRGYDNRGYASGISGNGNVVGFPTADIGTSMDSGGGMGEGVDVPNTKQNETPYKYGCIMTQLTYAISEWLREWSKKHIQESDLYVDEDSGISGYENDHHVTLLYGLEDVDTDTVDNVLNDSVSMLPEINFGEVSRFSDNELFDVIKINIQPELLNGIHDFISTIPHKKIHPTFMPHITLAYVKKGTCSQLDGNKDFIDIKDKPETISYCDRSGDTLEYYG